jgi:hypothetical protein
VVAVYGLHHDTRSEVGRVGTFRASAATRNEACRTERNAEPAAIAHVPSLPAPRTPRARANAPTFEPGGGRAKVPGCSTARISTLPRAVSIHRNGAAAPLSHGSGLRSGMARPAYPAAGDTSGRDDRGVHDA